jgi:hypothetical protein
VTIEVCAVEFLGWCRHTGARHRSRTQTDIAASPARCRLTKVSVLSLLPQLPKRPSGFFTHRRFRVASRFLKVRNSAGPVANSYQRRA